jgi:hypothetical protein
MKVSALSEKHLAELDLAISRAAAQWCSGLAEPWARVQALERVLLFLRQNGSASRQARHVASLGFLVGQQVVELGGWTWASVSDDDGVNPSIVAPDATRACLVIDVATLLVAGEAKGGLGPLVRACVDGGAHPLVVTL